ncbi:hypothetical protein F0919_03900 [Taibaiella lutea]|uniref:DUF4468 domain-containing protein n=1 Tax=Taibaiella lutea TaxID=2608001 RepID=A0A5M6CPC9_9BACT|nr:hypothetical protein [Taibaiella lutea]KAA5536823.1 hypothetical protein F0919_03900 [Taibaiella lutea]
MKNTFLLIALLISFTFASAQKGGFLAPIKIVHAGPSDAFILPVVIVPSDYEYDNNDDSLAVIINEITINKVDKDVYLFIRKYFNEHKYNVKNVTSSSFNPGSCVIYEEQVNNDRKYYMCGDQSASVKYLEKFVSVLKTNQKFRKEDIEKLINNLNVFISAIRPRL